MSTIADRIIAAVKALPEQRAAEVLDFVEFLKAKSGQERTERRNRALAILDKHRGIYDGAPFDREELHERP